MRFSSRQGLTGQPAVEAADLGTGEPAILDPEVDADRLVADRDAHEARQPSCSIWEKTASASSWVSDKVSLRGFWR